MPKLTRKTRTEKHRKRYLKYLDKIERGLYVDCDGVQRFRALPQKQLGRPRDYRKRLRNHG